MASSLLRETRARFGDRLLAGLLVVLLLAS